MNSPVPSSTHLPTTPSDVDLPYSLDGIATLTHLGVIRAAGMDAASFLQGQLTQDFVLLGPDQARLAAFCSAKGRMQASFIGFKRPAIAAVEGQPDGVPEILLICSRDILAATLKRLSLFVMRAKVKLTDATDEFQLLGLAGSALKIRANNDHPTGTTLHFCNETLVVVHPADGVARALWVAPLGVKVPDSQAMSLALWQWGEVRSGIATITVPVVDAFVPQMLNYESVGGVNFKKGCYPGQEVVARSQFRGTLKRRAYLMHCARPLVAGDEVFGTADAEQACGTVVQAAACPAGGFDALVSMQVSAALAGGLTLGSASGAALQMLALPYPLLDDI
jgi:folate-binding protein YgfZ